jgi:hypothetical protein
MAQKQLTDCYSAIGKNAEVAIDGISNAILMLAKFKKKFL